MNKKVIRLAESDLHNIIGECLNQVLNEDNPLLQNARPVPGQNYEVLAKNIFLRMRNDEQFQNFLNTLIYWYKKDDANKLTNMAQKLITNLIGYAKYNMFRPGGQQ